MKGQHPVNETITHPASQPSADQPREEPLPGSRAALWRAAADRLATIEGVAYDGADAIDQIGDIDGALAELVVRLRALAPLWVEYLRERATVAEVRERTARIVFRDDTLTQIARTILEPATPPAASPVPPEFAIPEERARRLSTLRGSLHALHDRGLRWTDARNWALAEMTAGRRPTWRPADAPKNNPNPVIVDAYVAHLETQEQQP